MFSGGVLSCSFSESALSSSQVSANAASTFDWIKAFPDVLSVNKVVADSAAAAAVVVDPTFVFRTGVGTGIAGQVGSASGSGFDAVVGNPPWKIVDKLSFLAPTSNPLPSTPLDSDTNAMYQFQVPHCQWLYNV